MLSQQKIEREMQFPFPGPASDQSGNVPSVLRHVLLSVLAELIRLVSSVCVCGERERERERERVP